MERPDERDKEQPTDERTPGGPALEQQDWDAIRSGSIAPDSVPENGDLRYDADPTGELPGEDDDNPYQNSDEALPDEREEAAIRRNPGREGGRFHES